MSIIGGVGFLSLGLWLESAISWRIETLLVFGFLLFVAVIATMLSTRWRPQSWNVKNKQIGILIQNLYHKQ